MAFTTIDDPSVYFQTALYTGNGSSNAITNDGNSDLQADWIWLKERSSTSSHHVFDSTRGIGDSGKALLPDSTGAEGDDTAFRSFDSDGFTLASTNGFNQNTITNLHFALLLFCTLHFCVWLRFSQQTQKCILHFYYFRLRNNKCAFCTLVPKSRRI